MNRKVCEGCLRYGGVHPVDPNVWMCAEELYSHRSRVLPGHRVTERGEKHIPIASTSHPPEWCSRIVRHGFTEDGEEVSPQKDPHVRWVGEEVKMEDLFGKVKAKSR